MAYWARIALGALLIFGIGMGVVSVIRSSRGQIEAMAQIPRVMASIPERFDPLRVDGVDAGTITRVQIDQETDMTVTLAAKDSAAVARLAECTALAGDIDDFLKTGLSCSLLDTLDGYGSFGRVTISGADMTVPLYAPHEQVSEFHADGHDAEVDIQADSVGETFVRITDNEGNERVHIRSDAQGRAVIQIRGDDGSPIFQFRADSHGVQIGGKGMSEAEAGAAAEVPAPAPAPAPADSQR